MEAVRRYRILDSNREGTFDRITKLAASILDVPRACVNIVDADRSWFKSVSGFEADEISRAPGLCEATILSEEIFHVKDAREDSVAKTHPLVTVEDGIRFYVGSPLRTAEGLVIGTLCAFGPQPRELTANERKWMVQLADFAMHEIESRRVRLELRDTEGALRQAQRLGSIGLVASGVAHDFNNLLSGIIGNVELLKQEIAEGTSARELVDEVHDVSRRSSELVGQVLAHAGSEEVAECVPIDLNALVEQTRYMLESVIHENTLLELDLTPKSIVVDGNSAALRQLIMNLITNASEAYDGKFGVVRLSAALVGDRAHISVADSGKGLSSEAREQMFEPFFTTKDSGRGLGLAVIKRILDNTSTTIDFESKLGIGTVFTVTMPLSSSDVAEPSAINQEKPVEARGETIMVVDDEHAVLTVARRILQSRGYEVLEAEDGMSAIKLLTEHKGEIAAVLLDMSMPTMSGEETLIELKKIDADLKVILSSGHTEEQARSKFTDHELAGFLKKPYGLTDLLEMTAAVLKA